MVHCRLGRPWTARRWKSLHLKKRIDLTAKRGGRPPPASACRRWNWPGRWRLATDPISLFPDFREFLRLLNSANVRYMVVGGYAVNYHGHQRTTGDLDVWIAVDAEN